MTARQRHISTLEDCTNALNSAASSFDTTGAGELLAEDLKSCANSLEEITGSNCSDELLGEIFSKFCIGK